MIDMDFVGELLAQIKSGITEKKLEVDRLFENDITEGDYKLLFKNFKEIISHFVRFNKKHPINRTRYSQKNDFYTLFGFIKNNITLKKDILDMFYEILVLIGDDITPSNEECVPFYNYALNCVSQSNSREAREGRESFLNKLFLNTNREPNDIQKGILDFYKLTGKDMATIGDYLCIRFK